MARSAIKPDIRIRPTRKIRHPELQLNLHRGEIAYFPRTHKSTIKLCTIIADRSKSGDHTILAATTAPIVLTRGVKSGDLQDLPKEGSFGPHSELRLKLLISNLQDASIYPNLTCINVFEVNELYFR